MKKNILIWGTGKNGEKAYKHLISHRDFFVIAFGDNDVRMYGRKKFGKDIIGPLDVQKLQNLQAIVIASAHVKNIHKQLESIISDIPIYDNIEDLIYTRISIDISGFCNAKCKWCITGKNNRYNKQRDMDFMKLQDFIKVYQHIYENGLIDKNTEIMLYSWGEPFLNEDYIQIIEYLAKQNQIFSVSTNASIAKLTKKENTYQTCKAFIISMPGFSQISYDHIHGFNFKHVKANIIDLVKNINQSGFHGDGSISFHIYKFNGNEINAAKQFADALGFRFNPYYPYFNGNSMTEEFLNGQMNKDILQQAKAEMYLDYVDELIKGRPKDYRCFLENIISIDCNADLTLCCAADCALPDYKFKSIFEISSLEEMKKYRVEMLKSRSCEKCRTLGIDYWMENNPSYSW